jgi:hypothetical protein
MIFLPSAMIHDGQPVRPVAAEVQINGATAEAQPRACDGWTLVADTAGNDSNWAPGSVGAPSPSTTDMNPGADTKANPSSTGTGTEMNRDTSGASGTTRGGTDTQANPSGTGTGMGTEPNPTSSGSSVPGKDGNPTPAPPSEHPSAPYDSPGAGRPETSPH